MTGFRTHRFIYINDNYVFLLLQCPGMEGIVNEDLPNSWECPKCCKEGKNVEYRVSFQWINLLHLSSHPLLVGRVLGSNLHPYLLLLNIIMSNLLLFFLFVAALWRKRLAAHLPLLGSRVRVSVTPCGFRGGRKEVWVGFSRGFSRFPLPQISFHHFSTLISPISFHFIRPCDGVTGVVGRHPCYSLTYNIGASSHLIPRPDLVLDTSWGYLFYFPICLNLVYS